MRGIPSLVAVDSQGEVIHFKGDVDLRSLVGQHGADAFPLTPERVEALKAEADAKASEALKQIYDGTISCSIKTPGGSSEVSLTDLLSKNEHVGLVFGDGDMDDRSYANAK